MKNYSLTTLKPAPYRKGLLWSLILTSASFSGSAFAQEADPDAVQLATIDAVSQTEQQQKKHDVTGLGNLEKTDFFLQESQVENIRDLTRYDPGISVNEAGGRGTSRGFAIRGVEKERVAINVDGLASAPILRRDDRNSGSSPSRSSASINEVEYENLKLVDIRKGSSSTESGSGALGGAVSMTTKDTSDFFFDDSPFAARIKAGYTSKDKRNLISAGVAARHNGWEGFAQFTRRQGHEIRSHSDLYKNNYVIKNSYIPGGQHTFNAENISGEKRRAPNPLDFKSQSFLSKGGYNFNDEHYLGAVIEDTQHDYGMRDMFVPNYHSSEKGRLFDFPATNHMVKYTPTRHYFDQHKNRRAGLEYKYRPLNQDGWLDHADVRLDWRHLQISTDTRTLNCAPWPAVNPDCWPQRTPPEYGQLGIKTFAHLDEKDVRLDTDLGKTLNWGKTQHQLRLQTGVTASSYRVDDTYHRLTVQSLNKKPDIKEERTSDTTGKITGKNFFIGLSDKALLTDSLEANLGLRYDHTSFNANPNAHQKKRGMTFTGSSFNNFSWDAGISFKPIEDLKIAYRISSGFRVPSVIEQIGPSFNTADLTQGATQGPLKSEKSLNQEIGITYNGPIIKAEGSYFITQYKDMIDYVSVKDENGFIKGYPVYLNSQNFTTHGFDLKTSLNVHALWDKLPEGLELFGNAGITKIKKASDLDPRIAVGSTYSFDAIQPLKFVYGANYHNPNGHWGMSLINTYSKAKNLEELQTTTRQGGLTTAGGTRFAKLRSGNWWTTDITAYYNVNDNITLRAGIYNLFDYRYYTWESVRQTSFGSEARIGAENYSSLIAPGRNFLFNFEIRL